MNSEKQTSIPLDLEKERALYDSASDVAREDGVSAIYDAKSRLINEHMQNEVGFGRYQFQLFLLTGLGWAADNIWLQGVAIILPQIQRELQPTRVEYTTLALYVGLILGATTWGILADLIGRRLSFNITLFIAGVFGVCAGAANNFTTLAALIACVGFGIGGNLPVDGAIFLESVPKSHQWLLTLLSAWWALGQLFASLVAWPLIGNFSCPTSATVCLKEDNMGWRYTFGGVTMVMWIMRFVVFDLQESAKYMIAKGRDEEAVKILEHIAEKNGRKVSLTVEALRSVSGDTTNAPTTRFTTLEILKNTFSKVSLSHVTPLFSTKRLAINTSITIILWGLIGLAYPLFNGFITLYLTTQVPDSNSTVSRTYRDYTIISILGVPGSIIACLVVDWTRKTNSRFSLGGRKLTMAVSTALNGVFLFLFTTSKSQAAVLGFSCASGLTHFPGTPSWDWGCVVLGVQPNYWHSCPSNQDRHDQPRRICEQFDGKRIRPIFVSATLFLVSSVLMVLLPIETAGKAAI
ncbi:sugar transporter [Moniliophthora roreri]|nr:sugar transporter [Moniliophthora roreri]